MKKSLKDTYVYKVLDLEKTVAGCAKINNDIASYALKGDQLDAIVNDIKYKINFPAKIRILDELKSGSLSSWTLQRRRLSLRGLWVMEAAASRPQSSTCLVN